MSCLQPINGLAPDKRSEVAHEHHDADKGHGRMRADIAR
jgi:hypothetical protein